MCFTRCHYCRVMQPREIKLLGRAEWARLFCRFWSERLKRSNHLEGLDVDGRIILEMFLSYKSWNGLMWLRTRTSSWLLCTR